MAIIGRGHDGPAYTRLEIEILGKIPETGTQTHGPVEMNTDLGVLKGRVSFHLGKRVFLHHEIWLKSEKLYDWTQQVMDFVLKPPQDDTHRLEVWWGIDNPEINLIIRRTDVSSYELMEPYLAQTLQPAYELLCILDNGNFSGRNEIENEGPAIFLIPDGQQLFDFAHDLRSEAEVAMLLGDSDTAT